MPIRTVSGSTKPTVDEQARQRTWANLPPEIRANPQVRAKFGLGDLVEVVARPVARAFGVDPGCEPCARRKELLNRITLLRGRRR